jgi:hypothetical protein
MSLRFYYVEKNSQINLKFPDKKNQEPRCDPPVSLVFLEIPLVFAFPLTC